MVYNFEVKLGQKLNQLCAELCNYMQCRIFVSLFKKMKVRFMISKLAVRLCDTLIMSNQTIGFYDIRYVRHAVMQF
jgi:hypothetical protein